MSDLIKRKDAITAINKSLDRETLLNRFVRKIAVDAIRSVPSADRPHGAWEYNNGDLLGYAPFHKCGVCGSEMYTTKDTFCPNCGARMKGADDETD